MQGVVADRTVDRIVAQSADDAVSSGPGVDRVIAAVSEEDVIPRTADDRVVAVAAIGRQLGRADSMIGRIDHVISVATIDHHQVARSRIQSVDVDRVIAAESVNRDRRRRARDNHR